MFEMYRVQIKDYWGFWTDVAVFDSEEKARRFVEALRKVYPRDEFRVVKEVMEMDTGIVIAVIATLVLLPLALIGIRQLLKPTAI